MKTRFCGIGDVVAFQERGISRVGRVVAIEDVANGDRGGRPAGRWFTIRIAGTSFEDIEVPENALGSILDAVA